MVRCTEQLQEDAQIALQKVRLLDAAEAVEFLDNKFSKWTLYELVKKGQIPHLKIGGNRVYFRPEALVDWLIKLEQASVAKKEPASAGIKRLK